MRRCVLDGSHLADAEAVYCALADTFRFPAYFGNNPDALWDALSDYTGEPVTIVWHNAALSAGRLGPDFDRIVAVLQNAAADGRLSLELA